MPRVLLLLDTTGPGGAETVFVELATRLGAEGFQALPVLQGPGWVADRLVSEGIDPVFVPSQGRFDVAYVRELMRMIRRTGSDLVHAHLSSTALYGGLAARLSGVPAVATFHGTPDLGSGGWSDRVRYALIRACNRRVVHVSAALRDEAVRRGLFSPRHTHVIHNGVAADDFAAAEPLDLRAAHGIEEDALVIGAVGNLRPLKDYPTLVRAAGRAAALPGRPLHFFIAGQGADRDQTTLLELAQSVGVAERLHLLGFVDDVPGFLNALDVFLLTSSSEGFSIATIQAMAAGKPVVVTRSGGPEEIVTDGVDGLLVPVSGDEAVARALGRLTTDTSLSRRLGDAARATVRRRFSIETMIARYAELYRSVLPAPVAGTAA